MHTNPATAPEQVPNTVGLPRISHSTPAHDSAAAAVGTYQQDRYGNVRRADALLLGLLSVAGAIAGVALANALSGAVLRDAFAAFMCLVAVQLVRGTLGKPR